MEYAEDDLQVSSVLAPLVIWFLEFSLSSLGNIAYACYLLSTKGTWGHFSKITFKEMRWNFVLVSEAGRGLPVIYLESSNHMVSWHRGLGLQRMAMLLVLLSLPPLVVMLTKDLSSKVSSISTSSILRSDPGHCRTEVVSNPN